MVIQDKTGKRFDVSHDQFFDALQTPTPTQAPKVCDSRPIPNVKPHASRQTSVAIPHTAPTSVRKVMTVPLKKSAISPEAVKEYKLRLYAERHNTQPVTLRRSARLAGKTAK